uniref:Protein kinase domain-containing protein n=1 Tax=Aegilops tauschii subsp. strangulata TaxID=200361 RepID=A0A453D4M4_AEGTS
MKLLHHLYLMPLTVLLQNLIVGVFHRGYSAYSTPFRTTFESRWIAYICCPASSLEILSRLYILVLEQFSSWSCSAHICICVQRITIPEIKNHPWFLKRLPVEMTDEYQRSMHLADMNTPSQSLEEAMAIIQEAQKPGDNALGIAGQVACLGSMDLDDIDFDIDDIDVESSGDFVCPL